MNSCQLIDFGTVDYLSCWTYQKELLQKKLKAPETPDFLLMAEHPEVVTLGRKFRGEKSANYVSIERGGEATLHNVGQLVIYPILNLQKKERDVPLYLRNLEEIIILTLSEFSIAASRKPKQTGVWVGERKIASIGVAISRWITYHGCALNIGNDLTAFRQINPCGLDWTVMTSMKNELDISPDRSQVIRKYCRHFEIVLGRTLNCGAAMELLSFQEHGKAATTPSAG